MLCYEQFDNSLFSKHSYPTALHETFCITSNFDNFWMGHTPTKLQAKLVGAYGHSEFSNQTWQCKGAVFIICLLNPFSVFLDFLKRPKFLGRAFLLALYGQGGKSKLATTLMVTKGIKKDWLFLINFQKCFLNCPIMF